MSVPPRHTTYDYISAAHRLVSLLCEQDGEATQEVEDLVEYVHAGAPSKLEACYHSRQAIDAQASLLRAEEKRLAARRQALERSSARIGDWSLQLLEALEAAGEAPGGKLDLPTISARVQWGPPALLGPEEVEHWPGDWQRLQAPVPDRAQALKDCKERELRGEPLPAGFRLERRRAVRWS